MAARKKKEASNGNGMSRAVAVLLENIQGQFRAFGERLQGMDERMERMDQRMERMDERMQRFDVRMQLTDDRMAAGFARVDGRMDRMEVDLGLVKTAVLANNRVLCEHGRLLKDVVRRDEIDSLVERAVARNAR